MCKFRFDRLSRMFGWAGRLKSAAVVMIGLAAATSWAAPANDNFANATVIIGLTSTINGSNVGATSEQFEPVAANVGGGKTIWYKWTAPFTGTELFNTEGSGFDTALAVYTGTNVTNLTLVAQNDDVAFPGDLTSQVEFPVLQGTIYYIQVDGNEGDSGPVILSWLPTGTFSAGQFGFGSDNAFGGFPLYVVGADDSTFSVSSGAPPALWMRDFGCRARVVRTTGTAGLVHVNYSITNTFYNNVYITNIFGTNIFATFVDTNSGQIVGTSNTFFTNFFSYNQIENFSDQQGGFFTCFPRHGTTASFTNVNGFLQGRVVDVGTNVYDEPIQCPSNITNAPSGVTNGNIVTIFITNTFCSNVIITTNVPSAVAGQDYLAVTSSNVTLVDYQLGANIPYFVGNTGPGSPGVTNPPESSLVNHLLVLTINSVTLDPLEGTNIAPPVIANPVGLVEILNKNALADDPCNTTNALANFTRSVVWMDEYPTYNGAPHNTNLVTSNTTARVYVKRTGYDNLASFSVNYIIDELPTPNGRDGLNQDNIFPLQPGSDYATPTGSVPGSRENPRFAPISGTLSWGARDFNDKVIDIPIFDDRTVQFNEDLLVELWNPPGTGHVGLLNTLTVSILFNDQPAGALDRDHNPNFIRGTVPPYNPSPGAGSSNDTVYAAVVQPDGKTVFGGDFRAYDTVPRNYVARMNADGSLDTSFLASPNSGANNTVTCMDLQPDGKVVIGGVFTSFNANFRNHVARLNSDGNLDTNFVSGAGVNGNVTALKLQALDGRVIIGGSFSMVNTTNRANIARLNPDGSLDTTFDPGVGPNGPVSAVAIQSDGKVVIGGSFTAVDNIPFKSIARLNTDGTLDTTFNPGPGADKEVFALAEQPDGKVLIGGAFTTINLVTRNSIARLNSDGSTDQTFDPGTGANGVVYTITLQPSDGKVLIGGLFDAVNGTRRVGLARLFTTGFVDTSFMDTSYNQFAGLINTIHNPLVQPKNFLFTIAVQPDGNVIIGGRFSQLGGGVDYITTDYFLGQLFGVFARDNYSPRFNIARLIGTNFVAPGATFMNCPGNVGLSYPTYSVDKANEAYFVEMTRQNGYLGTASVTLQPSALHNGPGEAVAGQDFVQTVINPLWSTTYPGNTWYFSDDLYGPLDQTLNVLGQNAVLNPSSFTFLNILNNPNSTGNLGLNLQLTQPAGSLTLGGEPIPVGVALGQSQAPMTIVDDSVPAGTISFSTNSFFVSEGGGNAVITVIRTDGSQGSVSVQYRTVPGTGPLGALPGATNDYMDASGTLTFGSGVTNLTFTVPIVDNFIVRPDRSLSLILTNITGGGVLGNSNATLTIINDNFKPGTISFAPNNGTNVPNYSVHEDAGVATIIVTRRGGSQGTEMINYSTSDGSATVANGDYDPTNGVLTWNNGDTSNKTFNVVLHNLGLVNSNLTVNLMLSNPRTNGVFTANAFGEFTNATLTILNDNAFGNPTFSTSTYFVNENAGNAIITVNRLGGSSQPISVDYTTSDGTAHNGVDYFGTSGTLNFQAGQFSQTFPVQIIPAGSPTNNDLQFNVSLGNPQPASGPGGGVTLGTPSTATVTIINNQVQDQPPGSLDTTYNSAAGFNATVYSLALQSNNSLLVGGDFTEANGILRNRIARLDPNGFLDVKFSSPSAGANGSVRAITLQSDGAILIGGLFNIVNGVNENYIARLNYDGTLDSAFFTGIGADNPVYAIAETFGGTIINGSNRKILVGGSFASIGGVPYRSIAQLNQDGTVDTSFSALGANGTIYSIAVYSTNDDINGGKILIGGDFTMVNGTNVNHIARLNADGTLDTSFNISTNISQLSGPNDSVRAIAIQVDGNVVVGGLFTIVSGSPISFVTRLDPSGQVDPTFNATMGANDAVTTIAIQQDLKTVLGGTFTQANGVTRNRITRLNSDGTPDPTINFGQGANDFVDAVVIQPDAKIIIGGGFTQYDGQTKRHLARIYGSSANGSGNIEFVAANFTVNQGSTNLLITARRVGGTAGTLSAIASTTDGTAISGVDYIGVTNLLNFPEGETFQTFLVPILPDPTNLGQLTATLNLTDPNTGILLTGDQSQAQITIIGANSTVSFSTANYAINKSTGGGQAIITVNRNFSTIGTASVDFFTTTNGTASPLVDYTPVTNTLFFADGQSNQTVVIPIANNGIPEGNLTVGLALANPTNTALDPTFPTTATLTIVDSSQAPGSLAFSAASYSVLQTASNAVITIIRTNGSQGAVSVNYSVGGGTATPNVDYTPVSGTLSFIDGQVSKTFTVAIHNNTNLTSDVTVNLTLTPGSGAVSGPPTVPLTILNQNFNVSFAQVGYFVDEKNGSLTIGVNRFGATNNTVTVNYATADGSAKSNVNYTTTSGTLTFFPGQTFQTFIVPITDDPQITGNLIFFVNLSKPNGSIVQLVNPVTTTVTILDDDSGFELGSATNIVLKTPTNAIISVFRSGNTAGSATVNFSAGGGSAPTSEYVPTSGTLTFVSGQTSNSFAVQILNDNQIDGDQTVNLALSNPSPGTQLLPPSTGTLTIVDTESGFSFSRPNYSVNENGGTAVITVLRTGVTNSVASVNYSTSDGFGPAGAIAGQQYQPASGTLIFTNGQTTATFGVTIIDNNVTGGSKTLNLLLSGPSPNSILLSPVAAPLTINNNDGSLIVASGSALLSPANGIITPNTQVTALFSLLNVAGSNTTVTATLLTNNGVTVIGNATQNYGTLVVGGPSVFRPFTFSVNGTNGGTFNAVLQLQYNTNVTTVSYTYSLGTSTNFFTNNTFITINDLTAATPYPSAITITNLNGLISKATVTVNKLGHSYVSDIAMLVVGPTGTRDLLMEATGGTHTITNVNITFDSTASSGLTTNAPVSGTFLPSPLQTGTIFHTSTNGVAPPPGPYGTNLNDFINTNPNGTWSLFVDDTKFLDIGSINQGWSLGITTLNVVTPNVDIVVGVSSSPEPVVVSNTLTYTVAITNAGPSPATVVTLTNVLPPGVTNVHVSSSQGSSVTNSSGNIVTTVGSLATNGTATVTIQVTPTASDIGTITNTVSVGAHEVEDNLVDNTASVISTVLTPSADLALGLAAAPNPVTLGGNVTYTISVTNLGPALAPSVFVTNTLPAGVTLVSSSVGYTNNGGIATFGLGNLAVGASTTFTVVAKLNNAGTNNNTFGAGSGIADLFKGNNSATAKTVVTSLQLGVSRAGSSLMFSWPVSAGNLSLQSTPNLNPPVAWTTLTNSPTVSGGMNTVTLPIGAGNKYFRLIGQ